MKMKCRRSIIYTYGEERMESWCRCWLQSVKHGIRTFSTSSRSSCTCINIGVVVVFSMTSMHDRHFIYVTCTIKCVTRFTYPQPTARNGFFSVLWSRGFSLCFLFAINFTCTVAAVLVHYVRYGFSQFRSGGLSSHARCFSVSLIYI